MRPYGDSLIWFIREAVTREQRGLRTLDSQSRLPIAVQSEVPALATNPIYLKQERLGEGGFGFVDRVWDVSTGIEYASKGFHKNLNSGWQQEVSMLRRVSHVSKSFLFFPLRDIDISTGKHCQLSWCVGDAEASADLWISSTWKPWSTM